MTSTTMTGILSASAPCPIPTSSSSQRLPSHSFIAFFASAALAAPPGSAAANYKVPRAAFFAPSSSPDATPFVSSRGGASLFSSSFVKSKKNSEDEWSDDDILKLRLSDIAPDALAGQVPAVDGVAEFRVAGENKSEKEVRLAVPAEEYVLRLMDDVRALQAKKAENERLLARERRVGERTNRRLAQLVKEGEDEAAEIRVEAQRSEEIRVAQRADAFNLKKKRLSLRMWERVSRSDVGSSVSGNLSLVESPNTSPMCSGDVGQMSAAVVSRAKALSEVGSVSNDCESKVEITDDENQVTEGGVEDIAGAGMKKC